MTAKAVGGASGKRKGAKHKDREKGIDKKKKEPTDMNRMAAGIIMQTMYGARHARWDLCRAVGSFGYLSYDMGA